jgi:hypothetical protein
MVHQKEKMIFLALLLLLPLTLAAYPQDYEDSLRAACLSKNPTDGSRIVWTFEVSSTPSVGQGGAVQTTEIYREIQNNEPVITYGNCIQVDCVQDGFVTDKVPVTCENKQLKKKYYDVSFEFPVCKPVYTTKTDLVQDPICAVCPTPKAINTYSATQCLNGKQVLSRQIEKYINVSCNKITATEYQQTNTDCVGIAQLDTSTLAIVVVVVLIGAGIVYWKKRK